MSPRHSVIIPAYNEQVLLPRLLDTLDRARARYHRGTDAVEVIVADNASTDRTPDLARERGCRVVPVARRAISAARNGGARAARGEILDFVDADIQVHPETFNEIDRVLEPAVVGGTSGIRFERTSTGLRCTYAMLVIVGGAIRMWYGQRPSSQVDTGVVFCRREDFEAIGGYNEDRLFAEDVQLLIDLGRHGRKTGRRLARGTRAPAIFSTRKFDRYGDWHYFTAPFRLPSLLHIIRRPATTNEFARRYWYERE